jgi:hypothetical protein
VVAKRIAAVAICGDVLVERVVLDGVDIGKLRGRQTGNAPKQRREYQCE